MFRRFFPCLPRSAFVRSTICTNFQVLIHRQHGKNRRPSGTSPTPRRTTWSRAHSLDGSAVKVGFFLRGLSKPQMHLIIVDLPAPLAPISAVISPTAYLEGDAFYCMDVTVIDVKIFNNDHWLSSLPRYASITTGFFRIAEPVPSAIFLP